VVGALLIPVCADWAKRGASGSARERDGAIHPRRAGPRGRETRRADRSRRQILEMRSPLTRHAAALADESAGRIERSAPRCAEFTPGWITRGGWRGEARRGAARRGAARAWKGTEEGAGRARSVPARRRDRARNNPIVDPRYPEYGESRFKSRYYSAMNYSRGTIDTVLVSRSL